MQEHRHGTRRGAGGSTVELRGVAVEGEADKHNSERGDSQPEAGVCEGDALRPADREQDVFQLKTDHNLNDMFILYKGQLSIMRNASVVDEQGATTKIG